MQHDIGGTRAMAWVARVLSPGPQVERARELEGFVARRRSLFGLGEPLDAATRGLTEGFFGYNLEDVRVSRGHQAEEASRRLAARAFTFRGHIFGPRRNLDTTTSEGLGLIAHELTHAIQQTQPHRRPESKAVNREGGTMSAMPAGGHSGAGMVLLARQSTSTTSNPAQTEAQAQASERQIMGDLAGKTNSAPKINRIEVADKVYKLMQRDLVLEGERATRVGG